MTAGSSLSEKEWVSRRKWTSMTLASVTKKATAMSGHGTDTGAASVDIPRTEST